VPSSGEALARAAVDAWNRGDMEALARLFADDVVIHSALARRLHANDEYHGAEGVADWSTSISQSLDFRLVLLIGYASGRARSGGPEVEGEYGAIFQTDGERITYFETSER
jgi:ketosteroid isomerase-like protein